jgi:ligand-binding SRPBCC domain-containing protein
MPIIRIDLQINAPRKMVFDLARNIDIHMESTSQTQERAIAGVTSGLIELGESVTWEAVHFNIKQRLTAQITEFDDPHYFVDEMVKGAFRRFRHMHEFEQSGEVTLMKDTFDYTSPFGWIGRLADKLFLEAYMHDLLLKRNLFIKNAAEANHFLETSVN